MAWGYNSCGSSAWGYNSCGSSLLLEGHIMSDLDCGIHEHYLGRECPEPVGDRAKVGDIIILTSVDLGDSPLGAFEQPAAFVVTAVTQGDNIVYRLRDVTGREIEMDEDACYFFFFADWRKYILEQRKREVTASQEQIALLKHDVALLRGILVAQGATRSSDSPAKASHVKHG
jgi:hypothetical protein